MGPRPFGRGRHTGLDRAAQRPLASMGPRPFGRGRYLALLFCRPRRPSFNGAATFRSRKAGKGRNRAQPRLASMGPRPFGRGRIVTLPSRLISLTLQWGRDLSVAEGGRTAVGPHVHGRRFNGAATFRSRKDGRANPARFRCRHGFNGAATFRSRKGGGRACQRNRRGRLQWGRDLSVAEGQVPND